MIMRDENGVRRLNLGPREWIAFASLLLTILTLIGGSATWAYTLDARSKRAELVLERLDSEREDNATVKEKVANIDRRLGWIEDFIRNNSTIRSREARQ